MELIHFFNWVTQLDIWWNKFFLLKKKHGPTLKPALKLCQATTSSMPPMTNFKAHYLCLNLYTELKTIKFLFSKYWRCGGKCCFQIFWWSCLLKSIVSSKLEATTFNSQIGSLAQSVECSQRKCMSNVRIRSLQKTVFCTASLIWGWF